jgi:fido (protein-threonine AMPylation protein)
LGKPVADPYVYPGTSTLANKLGITDAGMLRLAEYAATTRRTLDAPDFPLTAAGYRATHRHLFQDLYAWAGELRSVGIAHPRSSLPFAVPAMLDAALADRFRQLGRERNLSGLGTHEFAARAAHHISELNAIHPFREGNGRTMRLHLAQLADYAGHRLDLTRLLSEPWNEASYESFHTADSRRLAAVIAQGLEPFSSAQLEVAALSTDGRLFYAALSEKIDREMAHLSSDGRAELRSLVARELARKEEREGAIVLSAEQRHAKGSPAAEQPGKAERPPPAELREHERHRR